MAIGIGTSKYASPGLGPFRCGNCEHFKSPTYCNQRDVLQDAARGLLSVQNGLAIVEPDGCCNEFDPRSGKR